MAEEKSGNEEEEKKGGMKKIIIFGVAGLLLVGAGIGGALVFMGGKEEMVAEEEAMTEEEKMMKEEMMAKEAMQAVIYHDLHPAFVANFSGKSKKKYMQVYVVAMAKEQTTVDALDLHMPAIRNNILMTLSRKTSDEVATVEGKESLRQEVLESVQQTMMDKTGDKGVVDLYFTKFVAQ